MTTLHHFQCPVVKELIKHADIEVPGVIISGVSENYDEKVFVAKRVGDLIDSLEIDGALVAIDGWGNHHIDFVSIIEELGKRQIPTVGLSFFGTQGQLVYTSSYLDTLIDFNKGSSGYESCVVGQNNLSALDAFKAVALLKHKCVPITHNKEQSLPFIPAKKLRQLHFLIKSLEFGARTSISHQKLVISKKPPELGSLGQWIREVELTIIPPDNQHVYVNSILDFSPIACKISGELGEGVTQILEGITVMITGKEVVSQFQPANIGSSEGWLDQQVVFDVAGTPKKSDFILQVDVLFQEGEGRTRGGLQAAHHLTDKLVEEIRQVMPLLLNTAESESISYHTARPQANQRFTLIKLVSGLGNMYETALFPKQPAGYIGSYSTMEFMNMPVVVSTNQILDGVIHSLV